MLNIFASSATEAYEHILENLLNLGKVSKPRGKTILEILDCCIQINNPRDRIIQTPSRKFGLAYAIGELLWYISGNNDLETMEYYSPKMRQFSDDGKTLNSAYGYRIFGNHPAIPFNQWEFVKCLLRKDPDSRQAIIHLHTPNNKKTKDEVCTLTLQFFVRDGSLDMITNMRSNDIILGFAYDVFSFTMLQEIMANELHLKLGKYCHNVGSMHIYEEHWDLLTAPQMDTFSTIKNTLSVPMEKNTMDLKHFKYLLDIEAFYRKFYRKMSIDAYNVSDLWDVCTPFEKIVKITLALKALQKKYHDVFAANDLINMMRGVGERYADILSNRCNIYTHKGYKVIIEGIDGAGKTKLADFFCYQSQPESKCCIQHYGKPTANFNYYHDYNYALDIDTDTIFDRFFFSEIVYSTTLKRKPHLSSRMANLLTKKCIDLNTLFIFFVFDDNGLEEVASRLSAEDYDAYVKTGIYKKQNQMYNEIANEITAMGGKVIIIDNPTLDYSKFVIER